MKDVIIMNIYLTNLGKYNEGELVGEWVELPIDEDEFEEVFERIGIDEHYEEWFISDYETDLAIEVNEYANIFDLNEQAQQIADWFDSNNDEFASTFLNTLSDEGYSLEDAMQKFEDGDYRIYDDCWNMTEVAYQVIEEVGLLNDIKPDISCYFDYEAYGRDLGYNGQFIFLNGGMCIEIFD